MRLMMGDCLERMGEIEAGSVDLVLTDPPYGTTACKWDAVIPFESMWAQVWRVLKPGGAAVFTASQPFTSALVMSNPKGFRYCWVWDKRWATGGQNARIMPMRAHEDICVFGAGTYNPQMQEFSDDERLRMRKNDATCKAAETLGGRNTVNRGWYEGRKKYPSSVIRINALAARSSEREVGSHPTQKPVALMEYLIRTYTNEGETVLDFTMGSGTTGVACANTNRNFIGIERDPTYFQIAKDRIEEAQRRLI